MTAPETRFASGPPAYFGTALTRIVAHRDLHLRPQRQGSQCAPLGQCGTPYHAERAHKEHHLKVQKPGS
eukprot:2045603-Pyramimonas_sp.AAC.1